MGFFELFTPDVEKLREARDIRGLAKALGHADLQIARKAAAALADLPSPDAVPSLIQALASPDKDIRRLSATALGANRDPRAIPSILAAAEDPDLGVRLEAVKALGELGGAGSTAFLTRLTNDSVMDIRMAAVSALGRAKDPAAIPTLLQTLVDPHYGVRELSAMGLDALGWVPENDQDKALYFIAKREWSRASRPPVGCGKDPHLGFER